MRRQALPNIGKYLPSLLTTPLYSSSPKQLGERTEFSTANLDAHDLPDKKSTEEDSPRQRKIAILKSTGRDAKEIATSNIETIALLRKEFQKTDIIPAPAFQPILFLGDLIRVTELIDYDMLDFINRHTISFSPEIIKDLFAQLIMVLDQLHNDLDFVHRDIKLDNILIGYINGRWRIYLIDYEFTSKTADCLYLAGTASAAPPELKKLTKAFVKQGEVKTIWIDTYEQKSKIYTPLDKKAIDCYHLGSVFNYFYRYLCKTSTQTATIQGQITDLITNLTTTEPEDRLSIAQAKNHPLFGTSASNCKLYFETLKQELRAADPNFDGYNLRHAEDYFPEKNNGFYILPAVQKEIYLMTSSLNNQINSLTKSRPEDINFVYISIHAKASALKALTNGIKTLKQLHKDIDSIIKKTKPFADLATSRISQEEEFAKKISTEKLQRAVADAYQDYCKLNNFDNLNNSFWRNLFFRPDPGQNEAKTFNFTISNSTDTDPADIIKSILSHLEKHPGNSKKSFSNFLRTRLLRDVSPLPLEEWLHLMIVHSKKQHSREQTRGR